MQPGRPPFPPESPTANPPAEAALPRSRRWWQGWRADASPGRRGAAAGFTGAIDPAPSGDGREETDPQWVAHRNYLRRLRESGL